MILGVGTDIIEIGRIKKAVEKDNFIRKVFTAKEILYFENKNVESIAGTFCAKEAVSKALGVGFRGFTLQDIEILRNDLGKPYVDLFKGAKKHFELLKGKNIFISISHCKEYATAFALIED